MYYVSWHIALKHFGEVKMKPWMAVLSLVGATAAGFAGGMVMQADASAPSCVKMVTPSDIDAIVNVGGTNSLDRTLSYLSRSDVLVLSESILGDEKARTEFRAEALKLVALCGQIQSQP